MDRPRVLGIDDNPINLLLLAESLKPMHCEFVGCAGGADAIRLLSRPEARIAVVLLDLMMPEVDGFGVLRFMRAQPALAGLPVIVQSGLGTSDDIAAAIAAGANDYLVKPLTPERIITAVRRFAAI